MLDNLRILLDRLSAIDAWTVGKGRRPWWLEIAKKSCVGIL